MTGYIQWPTADADLPFPPMSTPTHLVLIGPMGSGKTTVGSILARRMGRPLVDSDEQIEAAYGRTGRSIAVSDGVDRLHDLEEEALRNALRRADPSVIAAAASVGDVLDIGDVLQRDDVAVVLLEGDAEVLARRAERGSHRRHIDVERSRELAGTRSRRLDGVVDLRVDVTERTPGQVAEAIVAGVGVPGVGE